MSRVVGSVADPFLDTEGPTEPGSFVGSAQSATSVLLQWTASTDNVGVAGYQIFRDSVPINTTASLSYTDTGRSPSTAYSYEVAAYDAAGNNSTRAGPAIVVTDPNNFPVWSGFGDQAHVIGENVAIELDLYCTDADGDTINYLLDDGSLPDGISFSGTRSEFLIGTPTTANVYPNITIGAWDGTEQSLVTFNWTITAQDTEAPAKPTGLAVARNGSNATLSWDDNIEPDLSHYRLYRHRGLGNWALRADNILTSNYNDTGLLAQYDYYYYVSAVDTTGNESDPSETVDTIVSGANVFVGPSATGNGLGGDSSNRCTFATLPTLSPGDVVDMAAGDYTDQPLVLSGVSGTIANPIIFQANDAQDYPVIKGSSANAIQYPISLTNCSYITIRNLDIDGTAAGDNRHPNWTVQYFVLMSACVGCRYETATAQYCNGWGGIDLLSGTNHCVIDGITAQYSGTPDAWTNATPGSYSGGGTAQQHDLSDILNFDQTTVTAGWNLIQNCTFNYFGHSLDVEGRFNIFRNNTVNNRWPEVYPTPWPANHPYQGRSFLAGRNKGNRFLTMRGTDDYLGRNVVENCTFTTNEEALDSGQDIRFACAKGIFRFNSMQTPGGEGNGWAFSGASSINRCPWEMEVYNNEIADPSAFSNFGGDGYFIFTASNGFGCSWNKVYNNAFGSFGTLLNGGEVMRFYHTNYANDPYPYAATPTNAWGENRFNNNSFTQALTALEVNGPIGQNDMVVTQADGTASNYVYGNQGGQYKRANGGAAHATITSPSGGPNNVIAVSTTNPFVAPNLYTQLGADEGDRVYINGVRVLIDEIDETNKTLTLRSNVTWTQGDPVSLSVVTDDNGNITTGKLV